MDVGNGIRANCKENFQEVLDDISLKQLPIDRSRVVRINLDQLNDQSYQQLIHLEVGGCILMSLYHHCLARSFLHNQHQDCGRCEGRVNHQRLIRIVFLQLLEQDLFYNLGVMNNLG